MPGPRETTAEIGARFVASMLAGDCFTSETVRRARSISMLHEASLWALGQCAGMSDGPVLELGPYIGGSCTMLAAGARHGVISVEIGGPNPGHPQTPTLDTIADLRRNLASAGLAGNVEIIEGHAMDMGVAARVEAALAGRKAGMMFVDIDPGTEKAITLYSRWLADGAILVVDDYASEVAVDKAAGVKAFIAAGVQAGVIEPIGLYPWGTWFGRLTGPASRLAETGWLR